MSDLFLLSQAQCVGLCGIFPVAWRRAVDTRIVSAIVFVIKNGLRWRDAPPGYGPQDDLQSVCSLEPPGGVQQDFRAMFEFR